MMKKNLNQESIIRLIKNQDFNSLKGIDLPNNIYLYDLTDNEKEKFLLNIGSIEIQNNLWEEILEDYDHLIDHLNSVLKSRKGVYKGYKKQLQHLANVITREEAEAITLYITYVAYFLTQMLLKDYTLSEYDKTLARQVFYTLYHLSLKMKPLEKEMVVHRFIDTDRLDLALLEHNFSSTSVNSDFIKKYGSKSGKCCYIKAYLQPGLRVIPVLGNAEEEIIIPPFNQWQLESISTDGVYVFKVFQGQIINLPLEEHDFEGSITEFLQSMANVLSSEDWKALMKTLSD